MVQASSSTAMARTATKITAQYGGLQSKGVCYKQTNHKQPGLRPGSFLFPHFCFTAIDLAAAAF